MLWWQHVVVTGALSLLVPTIVLLVSLRWGRAAFIEDYPEDIRRSMPEFTRAELIWGRILGPLFVLSLIAAMGWTTWTWIGLADDRGFLDAYIVALGIFVLFAIIDVVIVDWLVICWWRPSWVMIAGTEHAHGWNDYGFHLRAQLAPKALVSTFALPALVTGIAVVLPQ